ncbi:Ycf66 family protein [Phormidesmis priestleyi]|uniref:Ycf66 family protein n=1 Tax=Phormidesmis priestleyi TaxID=268141 RepID=UPI00083B2EAD|nr:Ycf66 family protein [Phormidesmis priestleyi]
MLTFILALVVGLASLALYLAAFFYPELHRKGDLIWSGVGLFYALVLWICAERITGGVLLGQMASVSLIGWLGWQTLLARSGQTPTELRSTTGDLSTDLQAGVNRVLSPENTAKVKQQVVNLRDRAQSLINKTAQPQDSAEIPTPQSYEPLKPEDFGNPPTTVDAPIAPSAPQPIVSSTSKATQPASPSRTTFVQPASSKAADKANPFAVLTDAAKSVIAGFNKPKKNVETYVRKDFRDTAPIAEAEDFDDEEDQPSMGDLTPHTIVSVDQNATSDSTICSDEIMQEEMEFEASRASAATTQPETEAIQPIHPNPPTSDLVEAAIADAEEKHLPAHPPEPAGSDE